MDDDEELLRYSRELEEDLEREDKQTETFNTHKYQCV